MSVIDYKENDLRSTHAPRIQRMNEMLSGGWKRVRLALMGSGEVDHVREGNARARAKCAKIATVEERRRFD